MRIGLGYDIHRLVPQRRLVLGGVQIPFEKGLLGHSDADVLLHAVADAMLGAAALGDIGTHFPDTDPAYLDARSTDLLERVEGKVAAAGYGVANVDATVFAEMPKISPYRLRMAERIARLLKVEPGQVSIKATTTEGLGLIGSGDAIAAMAVVLLQRK